MIKYIKENIGLALFILTVFFLGIMFGWGWGQDYQRDLQKRIECEVAFGNKPQSEITGNCLKYFKAK